ncbi:MAG: metallophosphoesterase [Chloroflexi bacterium]|nr:metallophosphoesterase [Chloroflexota bacterium]
MKIGIITDSHLYPTPGDGRAFAYHNPYPMERARAQLESAIDICVRTGVAGIAMLGDLSHIGDAASLTIGVQMLAQSGLPVWISPGNHDCVPRAEAMADAVAVHGGGRVKFLSTQTMSAGDLHIAGLPLRDEGAQQPNGNVPDVSAWGDDLVVWAIHHPAVSLAERTRAAGLKFPGDLGNYETAVAPVHARTTPTLAIHGHAHVRDELAQGALLQFSFAALIEPPHEVGVLEIDRTANGWRVRRSHIAAAAHSAQHLPILSPDTTLWSFESGAWKREQG